MASVAAAGMDSRRTRALAKKLRQIDDLLTRDAGELTPEQRDKVSSRRAIVKQLGSVLADVEQGNDLSSGTRLSSIPDTEQACNYFVKNTFLTTFPDAPKSSFFRMQSCPDTISNEPTKDSLPTMEMQAPELEDTSSNASDLSAADDTCPAPGTNWRRMETQDPCWDDADLQGKMPVNASLERDSSEQAQTPSPTAAPDARTWLKGSSAPGPKSHPMPTQDAYWDQADGKWQHMQTRDRYWDQTELRYAMPGNASFAHDSAKPTPDSHAMLRGYAAPEEECVMVPVMMPVAYPMAPSGGEMGELEGKTTVMMRNLPNKYTRALLLEELGRTGFNGAYDFIYVPIDDSTQANRGYAFINFVTPPYAKSFKETYDDCTMPLFNSTKTISVTLASLQGFEANYAHYANARCNRGDPASRPLFLREHQDDSATPWTRRRPLKLKKPENKGNAGVRSEDKAKVQGAKFCVSCGAGNQLGHKFFSECGQLLMSGEA